MGTNEKTLLGGPPQVLIRPWHQAPAASRGLVVYEIKLDAQPQLDLRSSSIGRVAV